MIATPQLSQKVPDSTEGGFQWERVGQILISGLGERSFGQLPLEAAQLHAVVHGVVDGLSCEVGVVATPTFIQTLPEDQIVIVAGCPWGSYGGGLVHIKYYDWLMSYGAGIRLQNESSQGFPQSPGLFEIDLAALLLDDVHQLVGHAVQFLVLLVDGPLESVAFDAEAGVILAEQVADGPNQPYFLHDAAAFPVLLLHLDHAFLELDRQIERGQFWSTQIGVAALGQVVAFGQQVLVSDGQQGFVGRWLRWFSKGLLALEEAQLLITLHS